MSIQIGATLLTLGRPPHALCAVARVGTPKPPTALVFVHGAGLDPLAPLYIELASGLAPVIDTYLVSLRASGFVTYNAGFRRPLGWAHHVTAEAVSDITAWVSRIADEGYEDILVGGHSWGGLLSLQVDSVQPQLAGVVLLSPLARLQDIIEVNYGGEDRLRAQVDLERLPPDQIVPAMVGAPLGFLTAKTIRTLIDTGWSVRESLKRKALPALILSGAKEHAQLRDAVAALAGPDREVREIAGEGHFYTSGAGKLAAAVLDWWGRQQPQPRGARAQ